MPCKCCGASRPSKGFKLPLEHKINEVLKEAVKLIESKNENNEYDDLILWKKGWEEAFSHHLYGCPEKDSKGMN